jgi:hypothetical protein
MSKPFLADNFASSILDESTLPYFDTVQVEIEDYYTTFDNVIYLARAIFKRVYKEIIVKGISFEEPLSLALPISENYPRKDVTMTLAPLLYCGFLERGYPIQRVVTGGDTEDSPFNGLIHVDIYFG